MVSRGEQSLPSISWLCSCQYSPGFCRPLLPGHARCSACCSTERPGPFLQSCSPASWSPACMFQGLLPSPMQDFTFLINGFCKVPQAHSFSLFSFLWMIILPLSMSAGFPLVGIICKPDESVPHHFSHILTKMLNRTDVNTDPWGALLVMGLQVEYDLLTTILAWSSKQLFIHLIVHPSSPCCPN